MQDHVAIAGRKTDLLAYFARLEAQELAHHEYSGSLLRKFIQAEFEHDPELARRH
jgi:hypothetical protein